MAPVKMTMSRPPKSILLGAEAPRVLTIPMLAAVLSDRRKPPARNTLFDGSANRSRAEFCGR